MFWGTIRRDGDDYIVDVPDDEVERLGLHDGQTVVIHVQADEPTPELHPELREHFEAVMKDSDEAPRYLADH
jgi:hypothetical protein